MCACLRSCRGNVAYLGIGCRYYLSIARVTRCIQTCLQPEFSLVQSAIECVSFSCVLFFFCASLLLVFTNSCWGCHKAGNLTTADKSEVRHDIRQFMLWNVVDYSTTKLQPLPSSAAVSWHTSHSVQHAAEELICRRQGHKWYQALNKLVLSTSIHHFSVCLRCSKLW